MTPSIYNELNPAGFEYQILDVQNKLACLNFIEGIFGVCRSQVEIREDKLTEDKYLNPRTSTHRYERWYPQGKKLGGDVDLTFDDSYISRIFFQAKDPINTSPKEDDWNWQDANVELKQPFSIYFHCNFKKIQNLNLGIINTEQIKLGILYALSQCPKLVVNQLKENIDNVWEDFSMTPEINGFGRFPFYCLKLDAEIYYYAFPNNGSQVYYDPSVLYNSAVSITPNSDAGYANVN